MVVSQRVTAEMDGSFVVFLIGMRINRWWKPWKWLPVGMAMGRMLRELEGRPEYGLLGWCQYLGRTTMMVSYWRSTAGLMRFASDREATHLPAWAAFNRSIGTNGDVGIWHETYVIQPGGYENVYANMPPFGLGAVGRVVEARGHRNRAMNRLSGPDAPVEPAPGINSDPDPSADAPR